MLFRSPDVIFKSTSVGTVLIFKFDPGLGTEASVPRFHGTGTCPSVPVRFRYEHPRYQGFGTRFLLPAALHKRHGYAK